MTFYVIVLFVLLCVAIVLSLLRKGRKARIAKASRVGIVLAAILFFSYWFFQNSFTKFLENSVTVQCVNKLSDPIDFYIVKPQSNEYAVDHLGVIHPNFYRNQSILAAKSDEYWLLGYAKKKQLVYFSQHALDKEKKQVVVVQNYINQSMKLSDIATKVVDSSNLENVDSSILVSFDFLLLFVNIILLFKDGFKR